MTVHDRERWEHDAECSLSRYKVLVGRTAVDRVVIGGMAIYAVQKDSS